MTGYDVVVVGAGASGAVVASRLSEDPDRSVLLVEAGNTPTSASAFPRVLLDGGQVPGAQAGLEHHWTYPVQLADGRPYTVLRGRVLGGSTTTNGGYFVRARREDFDAWSAAGNVAWSYDAVLPFMRRMETDLDYGATAIHGGSGPIPVRRPDQNVPSVAAFADAAQELGFPYEQDKNDQGEPGVGPVPLNIENGVRWNTGLAYVIPALSRPNFTVTGNCRVQRVVLHGTRVRGVELSVGGQVRTIDAERVVLCAGAFESPRLLLRSGIGPARRLRQLGAPVVWDAPGVARRFSDHPQVVVEWRPKVGAVRGARTWMASSLDLRSDDGPECGELQILHSTVPMEVLMGRTASSSQAPLPLLASVNSPVPAGTMDVVSTELDAPLVIDYHYLATPVDRSRLRQVVRTAWNVLASPAFSAVRDGAANIDARTVADDDALDDWIRQRIGTALHASGTAPMGAVDDPDSVVDQHGRVHHITGLHIADTSILPAAPRRGPAATAVLIGEVVADALRTQP